MKILVIGSGGREHALVWKIDLIILCRFGEKAGYLAHLRFKYGCYGCGVLCDSHDALSGPFLLRLFLGFAPGRALPKPY